MVKFLQINLSRSLNRFAFIDYVITFLLIQSTVQPFFSSSRVLPLILFALIFTRSFQINREVFVNMRLLILILIYFLIAVIQGIRWEFSFLSVITSFTFTFLTSYYLYRAYGLKFFYLLERVIYILTILSLSIYFVIHLSSYAELVIRNLAIILSPYSFDMAWKDLSYRFLPRALIFYTYRPEQVIFLNLTRNAGFSHEAGGFAVILILALSINYVKSKNFYNRKTLIYSLGILTTFSTAGYLALFILFTVLLKQSKHRLLTIIFLPLIVYSSWMAFDSLPFMKDKLISQYEEQSELRIDESSAGRFIGAKKSLIVMLKYPLHGRGIISSTKAMWGEADHTNYGFLSYLSNLGLIWGIFYLYLFIKGFRVYIRLNGLDDYATIILLVSNLVTLSAQVYFQHPYFMIFFIIGLFFYTKKHVNMINLK